MNKNNKTMNKKQPEFVNRSTADEPKKNNNPSLWIDRQLMNKKQPKFVNRSTVDKPKKNQMMNKYDNWRT